MHADRPSGGARYTRPVCLRTSNRTVATIAVDVGTPIDLDTPLGLPVPVRYDNAASTRWRGRHCA